MKGRCPQAGPGHDSRVSPPGTPLHRRIYWLRSVPRGGSGSHCLGLPLPSSPTWPGHSQGISPPANVSPSNFRHIAYWVDDLSLQSLFSQDGSQRHRCLEKVQTDRVQSDRVKLQTDRDQTDDSQGPERQGPHRQGPDRQRSPFGASRCDLGGTWGGLGSLSGLLGTVLKLKAKAG